MKAFRFIGRLDMSALAAQLDAHPELWDRHPWRTEWPPFRGTHDLILRWRRLEDCDHPIAHLEKHYPVFYPAWHTLTAAHPIVAFHVKQFRPIFLGAILITRIPAGEAVKPHKDGGWHANYCNQKFYCVVRGNDRCVNYAAGGERVVMRTGDCYWFDNTITHWVENDGEEERISLISCMRSDEVI